MRKLRPRLKSKIGNLILKEKFEHIPFLEGDRVCVIKGCGNRAICLKGTLCVSHWLKKYNAEHPDIPIDRPTEIDEATGVPVRKEKPAKKRSGISLTSVMKDYLKKVGVDKTDYDEMLKLAKEFKPDTKFCRNHYSWYLNQFKKGKL